MPKRKLFYTKPTLQELPKQIYPYCSNGTNNPTQDVRTSYHYCQTGGKTGDCSLGSDGGSDASACVTGTKATTTGHYCGYGSSAEAVYGSGYMAGFCESGGDARSTWSSDSSNSGECITGRDFNTF